MLLLSLSTCSDKLPVASATNCGLPTSVMSSQETRESDNQVGTSIESVLGRDKGGNIVTSGEGKEQIRLHPGRENGETKLHPGKEKGKYSYIQGGKRGKYSYIQGRKRGKYSRGGKKRK